MSVSAPFMRKPLVLLLIISLAVLPYGCAPTQTTLHQHRDYSVTEREPIKAAVGNVELVHAMFSPNVALKDYGAPDKGGRIATAGLLLGLLGIAAASADTLDGALALLMLTPMVLCTSCTVVAAEGPDQKQFRTHHPHLHARLHNSKLQMQLQSAIADHYQAKYPDLAPPSLSAIGPSSATEVFDYRPLALRGYDSVFESAIIHVALLPVGEVKTGQPRFLQLQARVRLVSTGSNQVLYENYFTYKSLRMEGPYKLGAHTISTWSADDGVLLEQELELSFEKIAAEIMAEGIL